MPRPCSDLFGYLVGRLCGNFCKYDLGSTLCQPLAVLNLSYARATASDDTTLSSSKMQW